MSVLLAIAFALVTVSGTATVFVRDPKRQILIYSFFGLTLGVLFTVLQAPDVALSEIAVGTVAIPFAVLATLVKIERT